MQSIAVFDSVLFILTSLCMMYTAGLLTIGCVILSFCF